MTRRNDEPKKGPGCTIQGNVCPKLPKALLEEMYNIISTPLVSMGSDEPNYAPQTDTGGK